MNNTKTSRVVENKIIKDANEFKEAILELIYNISDNIENGIYSGSILGEDLNSMLSKYGLLINVDWLYQDDKMLITLNYSCNDLDQNIRHGFDKYHLINFKILKNELAKFGISISRTEKCDIFNIDMIKKLIPFTDKLVLTMNGVKKRAPLLKNSDSKYVKRLIRRYNCRHVAF